MIQDLGKTEELIFLNFLMDVIEGRRDELVEEDKALTQLYSLYEREDLRAYIQGDVNVSDGIWGV